MNRFLITFHTILFIALCATALNAQDRPYLTLHPGMELSRDLRIAPYEYNFFETEFQPILVQGENFILDFSGAKLYGTEPNASPEQYKNVAIIIRNARNVKIENLNIHRFHVAIYIENSENIHFRNCDFSYNQRPRLFSDREHLVSLDRIQMDQLGQGELAAFNVFNSRQCTLESVKVSHGQHGILFKNCEQMEVLNSIITFNSGIGISLINSHQTQIRHNRLDYHNRGFSYGKLYEDFGAAGILLAEGSTNNQIGYNSITHCDKGVIQQAFVPSGDYTSGLNIVYQNDFSYCPMTAVELTGDSAVIQSNTFLKNRLGITGKNLEHIKIINNTISDSHLAIQLQDCAGGEIRSNVFLENQTSIFLPKRTRVVKKQDKNDPAFEMMENQFYKVTNPVVIEDPSGSHVLSNQIYRAEYIPSSLKSKNIRFRKNTFNQYQGKKPSIFFRWQNKFINSVQDSIFTMSADTSAPLIAPAELPMNTQVWPYLERGQQSIMLSEYGPYDFKYPFLYAIGGRPLQLKVMGPNDGAWSLMDRRAIDLKSETFGNFPDTIAISLNEQAHFPYLQFKYIGRSFPDQRGEVISPDDTFYFYYPESRNKRFIPFQSVSKGHSFSNCESSTKGFIQAKLQKSVTDTIQIEWARMSLPNGPYKLTCFDVAEPYICLNNEMMRLNNLPTPGLSEIYIEIKGNANSISIFKNSTDTGHPSSCMIEKVEEVD